MYKGIVLLGTTINTNDGVHSIVNNYRMNDSHFNCTFLTTSSGSLKKVDEAYLINQLLESIYHIYKFSNQSACINMKRVLEITFPLDYDQIMRTQFYKKHKQMMDKIIKVKNVYYC